MEGKKEVLTRTSKSPEINGEVMAYETSEA